MIAVFVSLCLEIAQAPCPPQAPPVPVVANGCACLAGGPCYCADCPCAWDRYRELRAQAILDNKPLVVVIAGTRPDWHKKDGDWLTCEMPSLPGYRPRRVVVSVPAMGDLYCVGDLPLETTCTQIRQTITLGRAQFQPRSFPTWQPSRYFIPDVPRVTLVPAVSWRPTVSQLPTGSGGQCLT